MLVSSECVVLGLIAFGASFEAGDQNVCVMVDEHVRSFRPSSFPNGRSMALSALTVE